VGAIMLVIAVPREVAAQSANATLRGKAPPSSEVTAKNTETGLTRRIQAGSDGTYTLVGLPPGPYQVDAGPGTERSVTLLIASTATLDFEGTAEATSLGEVVVSGARLTEVKTSEIGTGISLHQIETTPQITHNFLEFADTVPGMQFTVDAKGNTQIRSGTLNTGTTNVYIDGVGQKNYVRASGLTGQGGADPNQNTLGDPGNPFPQLAIGEYKVITSNYKAEYDQVSGAAITAVTRSGTNEFETEAFMTYTNASFRASTPAELAADSGKKGGASKEYGIAVGGPIIQDKLHYFFTYEGKQFTTPNTVAAPPLTDTNNVPQDWVGSLTPELRANYGPVANPFKENLFFGKVDWEFSDADRLEFTSKYRRERQQAGSEGIVAASAASTYVNDDHRFQMRWEHTSGDRFNEALVTYEKTNDSPAKISSDPGQQYVALGTSQNGFDPILRINGVDPRSYFFTAQRGYGIQDDLTFSNLSWHGDHTVKTGIKFKDVKLEDRDAGTSALYSYYVSHGPGGSIDADPFQVLFGAQGDTNLPTTSTSKNRQYGIYIQDDWAVNDRLLLNVGVRYDYEETPTFTDFVTPQRFVTTLNSVDSNACVDQSDPACPYVFSGGYHGAQPGQTYAQTLANAGININDYISNGHNRSNPSDEIQPRLGLSFDINADQRHVIFAGAGRSYDRNVFGILQHETNKATLNVPTVQFFNAGNPGCAGPAQASATCLAWNDTYLTPAGLQSISPVAFGEMHLINNNLKAPYSNQFSLGMRNKVGSWNTSATLVRIISYNGVIASSGNFFGDGTWYWFDSGAYAGYTGLAPDIGSGQQSLFLFDNAKATKTTQVLLSFDKPYTQESGWSASFAYTYSNAKERLEFNGDYQFDYAHAYYSPYVMSNQVPKHRLVAVGSVDVPWGITLGAKVVLETPKPYTGFDLDNFSVTADGLNYNYLHTSRFPANTLGYGSLDLQATKSFKFGGSSALQVRIDLLNAFNTRNYAQIFDGYPVKPFYFTDGNLYGVPRTVKVGLNFKW
jgi:outer membrane receptor protein involved in Fe transport